MHVHELHQRYILLTLNRRTYDSQRHVTLALKRMVLTRPFTTRCNTDTEPKNPDLQQHVTLTLKLRAPTGPLTTRRNTDTEANDSNRVTYTRRNTERERKKKSLTLKRMILTRSLTTRCNTDTETND